MADDIVISTRIPKQLLEQVQKASEKDYLNEADFVRSAIRSELFRGNIKAIKEELEVTKDSVACIRKLRDLLEKVSDDDYESWIKENAADMKGSIEID